MQILKRGIFLSIFLLSVSCETQNSSDDQIITNDIEKDNSKLNEIDIIPFEDIQKIFEIISSLFSI